MPAGIEIYNASGQAILTINDRTYRVLTIAMIGTTQSGTISVPELTTGSAVVSTTSNTGTAPPTIGVSGTNVSWNYDSVPSGERDANQSLHIAVF